MTTATATAMPAASAADDGKILGWIPWDVFCLAVGLFWAAFLPEFFGRALESLAAMRRGDQLAARQQQRDAAALLNRHARRQPGRARRVDRLRRRLNPRF